ncbi:patatin-like phospholipase family protein [Nocardioides sp. URHA0020]|uniref:patatin-like phospholipase family protein n=1 Tax=Nocardioides sp. URHA0020 TaxID=1380392 RepID=UPI0006868AF4|nr:patatin-like phospholipase family protein [Nocardioides sp. URHA0020]
MGTQHRDIFVLSGGGSRGAGQVGMLRVLLAAGIRPDLMVAGSVGSLNACFLAVDPTPARADELARVWASMTAATLTGRRRSVVGNVARLRPYLFSNDALRRLVDRLVPTDRLEDLSVPVRVATTDLLTGGPVHHDVGLLADVLCASAALPGLLPPVLLGPPGAERAHVDAGVAENLPLTGAADLARPGDRVWVLDVTKRPGQLRHLRTPLDVLVAALAGSITNRPVTAFAPGVRVLPVKLDEAYDCGPVFDFSHTAALVRMGEEAAATALAVPVLSAG